MALIYLPSGRLEASTSTEAAPLAIVPSHVKGLEFKSTVQVSTDMSVHTKFTVWVPVSSRLTIKDVSCPTDTYFYRSNNDIKLH